MEIMMEIDIENMNLFEVTFWMAIWPLLKLAIVFIVALLILKLWTKVAGKAAQGGVFLFGLPTIPFVIMYFLAIDIPMFGGPDWLGIKGMYAEHELLKLFLIGLPIFFFSAFYMQIRSGAPLLVSLIYSLVCWIGSVAACVTVFMLVLILIGMLTGKFMVNHVVPAAFETPQLMRRCPTCHGYCIPVMAEVCPRCGAYSNPSGKIEL